MKVYVLSKVDYGKNKCPLRLQQQFAIARSSFFGDKLKSEKQRLKENEDGESICNGL